MVCIKKYLIIHSCKTDYSYKKFKLLTLTVNGSAMLF